jgi:hypothetical protein
MQASLQCELLLTFIRHRIQSGLVRALISKPGEVIVPHKPLSSLRAVWVGHHLADTQPGRQGKPEWAALLLVSG